ncbi:hypothetical protein BpHYR1_038116 [Brachionus plicatilis]|uniref:Uncharacterized protein n=1 Tax=Brachionus plicatilis TaxID=10195 RepID=A0A3M7PL85_BRAPC|nr:hypothetical protein BpHYR1_038116 [Brachionus plicatilis]
MKSKPIISPQGSAISPLLFSKQEPISSQKIWTVIKVVEKPTRIINFNMPRSSSFIFETEIKIQKAH